MASTMPGTPTTRMRVGAGGWQPGAAAQILGEADGEDESRVLGARRD